MAFSNGSLPDGWLHRLQKKQPLAAPSDVKRYFVSPEESGQICMLACILGNGGEVFFPKLGEDQMLTFSSICDKFVEANGMEKDLCATDEEAKLKAYQLKNSELATDSKRIYGEPVEPTLNSQQIKYPTVYFKSDTTGEKAYEEFYIPGERINMDRFMALGVVEETLRRAQGRPIYPELVEGTLSSRNWKDCLQKRTSPRLRWWRPSRSLFRTLSMRKKGRTLIPRCSES